MNHPIDLPFRSAAVLGAGLMGRLMAVTLARAGCKVDLFDDAGPEAEGSAARVAGGMLAPMAESAVAPPSVVRMGLHSLTRWSELIASLPAPVFLQREGTLMLWHRQDAAEAARFARVIAGTTQAIPELTPMQRLDENAIDALEPALGRRFTQGLLLPDEGQLDNRALLAALLAALQAMPHVSLHWRAPRALDDFRPGEAGQPERVIDCRGVGARADWKEVRGVRGEVARVHAPEVKLNRLARLMHPRYSIYIAPKPDSVYVIGATEIESDDLSPVSVRSALELLSAAYTVHSGFAEARILELAAQCRPTLPDNLPAVRQPRPGVLQINGLYRHGYMIAPTMHDIAMELLATGRSALADRFDMPGLIR